MNERLEKVKKLYEAYDDVKQVEGLYDDVYTLVYDRLFPGLKKHKVTLAKDIDKQYDLYDYVEDSALVGKDDIAVVVDNRNDTDLVRAVAKELKLASEVRPYTTNTGKRALIAIIRIPEHISSMPADKYLKAIGKDIKDVRVKKGKEVEEGCKVKEDNECDGEECKEDDKPLTEEAKIYIDIGDFKPWSGAVDTWDKIVDNGLIDELDSLLEDTYPEGLSETELNDILWFDGDWVLDMLGIGKEEEDEEEDEEDVEEGLLTNVPGAKVIKKAIDKLV